VRQSVLSDGQVGMMNRCDVISMNVELHSVDVEEVSLDSNDCEPQNQIFYASTRQCKVESAGKCAMTSIMKQENGLGDAPVESQQTLGSRQTRKSRAFRSRSRPPCSGLDNAPDEIADLKFVDSLQSHDISSEVPHRRCSIATRDS
jgi:hypothetical protein